MTTGRGGGRFESPYDIAERVVAARGAGPVPELSRASLAAVIAKAAGGARSGHRARPAGLLPTQAGVVRPAGGAGGGGVLEPVEVRGLRHRRKNRARRAPATPRRVRAQGVLCPFDPLIWEGTAPSGCRLFYRIEITVPAPSGARLYVFPFCWARTSSPGRHQGRPCEGVLLRVPGRSPKLGGGPRGVRTSWPRSAADGRLLGLDGVVWGSGVIWPRRLGRWSGPPPGDKVIGTGPPIPLRGGPPGRPGRRPSPVTDTAPIKRWQW